MRHIYCDPTSRRIVCLTGTPMTAQAQGNRVRIDVTDTHPAIKDAHRTQTWQLNVAGDALVLTGQDPAAIWQNPPPAGQQQEVDRIAAAVRQLLGHPIP